MAFKTDGTTVTIRNVFNTGKLTFGADQVASLKACTFELSYTILDLFVMNSIVAQDHVRHAQKVTLTGKIDGFTPELELRAWGSSTAGTPNEVDNFDGQPTVQSPFLSLYDRNGKEIQYQLTNLIFKSYKLSTTSEQYGEYDFEADAISATLLYTS